MKNSKEYEPCDMNKHLSDTRFILLLAPYPKGSATALPEGAFVVYLNLKKKLHVTLTLTSIHVIFLKGYSPCSLRAEATFSPFSRYELASHASSHTEKMKPLLARYPPWDPYGKRSDYSAIPV